MAPSAAAACQPQRWSWRNPRANATKSAWFTGNDSFRLVQADDHADRLYRNAAGLFDCGEERHLIARCDGGPRLRTDTAGGNADVIETDCAEFRSKDAGRVRHDPTDHMKVTDARLDDGMLHIDLVHEVPEAAKPRKIGIGTSVGQPQVTRRRRRPDGPSVSPDGTPPLGAFS